MPVIAQTTIATGGVITPTETTLTSSDTFVYTPGRGQMLLLRNTTAGALSPTITGSAASAANVVAGFGSVSTASGLAVGSIAAGASRVVPLDSRSLFLSGTVTVTGGTGLLATVLT